MTVGGGVCLHALFCATCIRTIFSLALNSSSKDLGNNYANHLLNCAKIHLSGIEDGKNVDESFVRWRKKAK